MFTAYLRERFPLRIFGLAAIGITAAARWSTTTAPTPVTVVYATALSILLLLQFRVWDDLEDRARDSAVHPARVLVRTPEAPFRLALICLTLANVLLCSVVNWNAGIQIVFLDLGFYVAYRRTRRRVPDGVWRFSILLIKYPSFVVVVATALGTLHAGRLGAAVVAAYSTACIYEALHGRRHAAGAIS